MPEEGFLRRWARVKATGGEAVADVPPPVAPPAPVAPLAQAAQPDALPQGEQPRPAPTLIDAAKLTPGSDFSAFVSPNVDQDVRRLALKKLFADPHFNVMDRLDMYMDDYNKPDPVSATMLAALDHARSALRRPEEVQAEIARLTARDASAAAQEVALAAPDEPLDAAREADQSAEPGTPAAADNDSPQEQAPEAIARCVLPHADESDSDVIALTTLRAHNTQASL